MEITLPNRSLALLLLYLARFEPVFESVGQLETDILFPALYFIH